MIRSIHADRQIGRLGEEQVRDTLAATFKDTLTKTSTFHPMDYAGCGCWVEIKTRPNCFSYSFPTLMLSYKKIEFAKKSDRPVYIVFVLKDGIFYTEFDEERFATYEVRDFGRTDRHDTTDIVQPHIYIPVADLTKINALPSL